MAVDKASVLLIAPELVSVVDAEFDSTIAHAVLFVNRDAFGALADAATNYFIAHLLTAKSSEQEVSSVSVGGISKSFSRAQGGKGFSNTRYGAHYMQLVRATIHAIAVL